MIPSIEWIENKVKMIDQTILPHKLEFLEFEDYRDIAKAIKLMNIRGAPAIGVAAAMGMALASIEFKNKNKEVFLSSLKEAGELIKQTRPTAVNLFWAVDRILNKIEGVDKKSSELSEIIIDEAKKMWQEDIDTNKSIGKYGAELLDDGDTVQTHCNAGSLATVQYGTALAPVRVAIEQGKKISVVADETRPRLQGARLTAFELQYDKIPVSVISDGSSGLMMRLGKIQKIIVGADRITSDGVFNKIGTYMVALAAQDNKIPFYVAAPVSTLSMSESFEDVKIEERDSKEVSHVLGKVQIVPEGVNCINYAFDFTPFELVSAVITEDGVFTPKNLIKKYKR